MSIKVEARRAVCAVLTSARHLPRLGALHANGRDVPDLSGRKAQSFDHLAGGRRDGGLDRSLLAHHVALFLHGRHEDQLVRQAGNEPVDAESSLVVGLHGMGPGVPVRESGAEFPLASVRDTGAGNDRCPKSQGRVAVTALPSLSTSRPVADAQRSRRTWTGVGSSPRRAARPISRGPSGRTGSSAAASRSASSPLTENYPAIGSMLIPLPSRVDSPISP